MTRIVFLAAQVQPFLKAGLAALLDRYPVSVLLCYDRNSPILPEQHPRLSMVAFSGQPDKHCAAAVKQFQPDMAWCAGWMFRSYLRWCYRLRRSGVPCICALDTQWKNSPRQRLLLPLARRVFPLLFSHAWVPGRRQETFALRLGFRAEQIRYHLYSPDTALWAQAFLQRTAQAECPRRFLYVGRLEPHKLLQLLLAFRQLSGEERGDWHLELYGEGSLAGSPLLKHPAIRQYGYRSQEELVRITGAGGIGCLCSSDEPWGTVIQELAAAGLPLVVSTQCGAQPHFVAEAENGFICDGTDAGSIGQALLRAIRSSPDALREMGRLSHDKGCSSDSHTWAATLCAFGGK